MSSLTEQNQLDTVKTFFGAMARSAVAAGVAYHAFNHYGQMVVYARMNGVVPPSSRPCPLPNQMGGAVTTRFRTGEISTNASTTDGSKCVPFPATMNATASSCDIGSR